MSDINLLPEDLRDKEKKEQVAARKQTKIAAVKLSVPPTEAKKSFFERLFSKNKKDHK